MRVQDRKRRVEIQKQSDLSYTLAKKRVKRRMTKPAPHPDEETEAR